MDRQPSRLPHVVNFVPLRLVNCCVTFCDSVCVEYESANGPHTIAGVDMYRFPESESRIAEWYVAIRRVSLDVVPYIDTRVCALHFRPNDFMYFYSVLENRLIKKMLKWDAVPSVFYDVEELFEDFDEDDPTTPNSNNSD